MTCRQFARIIHEFLDGELEPRSFVACQEHVSRCRSCQIRYEQHAWIQRGLSMQRLSQVRQESLWKRIHRSAFLSPPSAPDRLWSGLRNLWRDRNPRRLWSRLAAVPLTLVLFMGAAAQFKPIRLSPDSYPILATLYPASRPVIEQVEVTYPGRQIDDLMSTVWKLPFEDSLSLVVSVDAQGNARIGSVLKYPKSSELLEAVGLTLQRGRIKTLSANGLEDPFLLYSFQKVDVYGGREGL